MVNLHHENIVRFITCWMEHGTDIGDEYLSEDQESEILDSLNETDFSIKY